MNSRKRKELKEIWSIMKLRSVSFGIARQMTRKDYIDIWKENGIFMQKCSYERYGTCEYPCNGDC